MQIHLVYATRDKSEIVVGYFFHKSNAESFREKLIQLEKEQLMKEFIKLNQKGYFFNFYEKLQHEFEIREEKTNDEIN